MGTTTAIAAILAAGTGVYTAAQGTPRQQGPAAAAKDPTANVYKDRNAQNAALQGGASTGTGSLLTSGGNVAGNTLLGQ